MKVVTFGEIMLRLSPTGHMRLFQNDALTASFGGAEANVAVSLSVFGLPSAFVTKLPEGPSGDGALRSLRSFGVDTSNIVRGGDRIGIYFMEKGASVRPSLCVYDRKHSSVAECSPEDFDWEKILEGCGWFHFTGITPALSDSCFLALKEALMAAKKLGITISCDLNYRSKLWTKEKAALAMTDLMKYVDVCISNEEDANDVFSIKAEGSDAGSGIIESESYKTVAKKLKERFGFKYVAVTLRTSISASDNNWRGLLYDGDSYYLSREYPLHLVDRVGGGDSFAAGLIYSLINGFPPGKAIEFAVAASALKQTMEGDFNLATVPEVLKLVSGDVSGRIKR